MPYDDLTIRSRNGNAKVSRRMFDKVDLTCNMQYSLPIQTVNIVDHRKNHKRLRAPMCFHGDDRIFAVNSFEILFNSVRSLQRGKQDQYALGNQLRNRYSGFLSADTNEVKARSSGRDRCLESMQTTLAALYKPDKGRTFESNFEWQPVPIQTMPVDIDGVSRRKRWLVDPVSCQIPSAPTTLTVTEHRVFRTSVNRY